MVGKVWIRRRGWRVIGRGGARRDGSEEVDQLTASGSEPWGEGGGG